MKTKLLLGLLVLMLMPFASANLMKGDCDGSGSVGAPDLNYMISYLSGNIITCYDYEPTWHEVTDQENISWIMDINGDNIVDILDYNLMIDVLGGEYDYWVYTNITQCTAGNYYVVEISDTQGFFTTYQMNYPCDYISNYVGTNGSCQSDGTLLTTFIDMSYNSTTDVRSYNITQNCTYVVPVDNGGSSSGGGGSSNECYSRDYLNQYGSLIAKCANGKCCKCIDGILNCWRSSNNMESNIYERPSNKTIEPIDKIPVTKSTQPIIQKPEKGIAWYWYALMILIAIILIIIIIWVMIK